jgi:NADH dehydrogenase FAD-containing subunit
MPDYPSSCPAGERARAWIVSFPYSVTYSFRPSFYIHACEHMRYKKQALHMDPAVPLTVVSPNNHFVFTPLLPSASVGTLEGRVIQEPIRSILGPNGQYLHAKARSLLPDRQVVVCETINHQSFEVPYDKLVIAVGVKTNTFGIQNIHQAAHDPHDCVYFLKQLQHARAIRDRIIEVFEMAALPTVSAAEKRRLLTFLVVGGGPTSCEFTAELHGKFRYTAV